MIKVAAGHKLPFT